MAEDEYERLQAFFFRTKPLVVESKQTVSLDDIKDCDIRGNIVPLVIPEKSDFTDPLNKELEIIKTLQEDDKASIVCEVCGGKYSYFNKNRHYLTKKHLSARPEPTSPPPLSLQ